MKDKMKTWLKSLSFKDFCIIGLVFFTILFYFQYRHYYDKSLTPVIVYNNDSIDYYKNKIKEEYIAKNVYVQTVDQLKQSNSELSNELKKLKDNPIVITKTDLNVKIDSLTMKSDTVFIYPADSLYQLTWHNQDEYITINGCTYVKSDFSEFSTNIDKIQLDAELTLNIIEKDNQLRLIGKSSNPYINVTNLQGTVIDPNESDILKKYYNKKKFVVGPQVMYGITSDLKPQFGIGIGITYNLWSF